jgi:hypothetical protein
MKSSIFFQQESARVDVSHPAHVVIVDQQGISARLPITEVPDGILRQCDGLKVEETGQVFRQCRKFTFPTDLQSLPTARPLYAQLRSNYELVGDRAMVFCIGLSAGNGFSIPSHDVIAKLYRVVDVPSPENVNGNEDRSTG